MEDKIKTIDINKISNKAKQERLALLAYFYQLGFDYYTGEERKEFKEKEKLEELQKELIKQRKLIIKEAKKKNLSIPEIIDYYFDHPEELLNLVGEEGLANIKVSKNLEKFRRGPLPNEQLDIFSVLSPIEKDRIKEYKIFPKDNINLSREEEIAITSLQEIFAKNNYESNITRIEITNDKSHISNDIYKNYNIHIPYFKFRPSEYLKFCGLKKYETVEGKMLYSGKDRDVYLRALDSVCNRPFIMLYDRPYKDNKGKHKYDTIKLIEPIVARIDLYEGLTQDERDRLQLDLMNGEEVDPELDKKGWICVKPSFAFVDGVRSGETYFNLLPENFNKAFKSIDTSKSKYPYRFMLYFFDRVSDLMRKYENKDYFEIGKEKLIYYLRLDKYKKEGRKKLVDKYLIECFEIAVKLDYLTRYEIVKDTSLGGKIVFYFKLSNPYFKHLNKRLKGLRYTTSLQ